MPGTLCTIYMSFKLGNLFSTNISIYTQQKFRNISYILSLVLIFSYLIPIESSKLKLFQVTSLLFVIALALIGTKNRNILLSFILIGLSLNVSLLLYINIPLNNINVSSLTLRLINLFITTPGCLLWIIGIWQFHKDKKFIKVNTSFAI